MAVQAGVMPMSQAEPPNITNLPPNVPPELNSKQVIRKEPRYVPLRITPQGNLGSIAISQTVNQPYPFTINAGTCFNPAKSLIRFNVSYAAAAGGAGYYNWIRRDAPTLVTSFRWESLVGGALFMDFQNNFAQYVKHVYQRYVKWTDAMCQSPLNGWPVLAIDTGNVIEQPTAGPATWLLPVEGRLYTQSEPILVQPGTAAAADAFQYMLEFRHLRGTFASMDKDIWTPAPMQITATLGNTTYNVFEVKSATDPNDATAATYGSSATISGIFLYLAVQEDLDVSLSVQNQWKDRDGYYIPWVHVSKNARTGTTHNVSVNYNSGTGRLLRRITTIPYWAVETKNTALDNCNSTAGVVGRKVVSFRTTFK